MNYDEFLDKLKKLKEQGPIESHRSGSTGIGKTLEDKLGIKENNIPGPDFDRYELKARRKESEAPITLFTKSPDPKGAVRKLWDAYGYYEKDARNGFIQTEIDDTGSEGILIPSGPKVLRIAIIAGKKNRAGIQAAVSGERIVLENPQGIEAYFPIDNLKIKFERKYKPLVLVLAECSEKDGIECFHYNEAYLLREFGFDSFLKLIKEGDIEIHLRVGYYPDGSYHDHGTAFRTYLEFFPKCFDKIEQIL